MTFNWQNRHFGKVGSSPWTPRTLGTFRDSLEHAEASGTPETPGTPETLSDLRDPGGPPQPLGTPKVSLGPPISLEYDV